MGRGWEPPPEAACRPPRTCPLLAAAAGDTPVAPSSSTSDTSTVTTDPTRTEQAPGHSLTGRRETQTAERREKERERWRERCRDGLPPQPAKNSVRNTGEETLTESRPWEERVQPSRWPGPMGHHPTNSSRGPTSLPRHKPCKGTASEGHCQAHVNMDNKGMLCRWSRLLEEPCPSCTRALPYVRQRGHGERQPSPIPATHSPMVGTRGHRAGATGHGTTAPSPRTTRRESRRSSKEHRLMRRKKEGRRNAQ